MAAVPWAAWPWSREPWDVGAGMDVSARKLGMLTVLLCRVQSTCEVLLAVDLEGNSGRGKDLL